MKKIFLPVAILLIFTLAACGRDVNPEALVESASNIADDVVDSVTDELSGTTEEVTPAPVEEPEPTEVPTEVPTEEPTEEPTPEPVVEPTSEPVDEPEEHAVFDELPEEVVLRGAIVAMEDSNFNLVEEGGIEVGNTFLFSNQPWGISFPQYNIRAGDTTLAADIQRVSGSHFLIAVVVPNLSETALGKEANNVLLGATLTVTEVGDANQLVKPDDLMEVALSDVSSSNPPYIVNFYRGEARELVATFTINNQ